MYRALTSFWSVPPTSKADNTRLSSMNSSDLSIEEDDWVLVSNNVAKVNPSIDHNDTMTNSWIASPPLIKNDEPLATGRSASPSATHHFNPIENLLIEHASMSVYEQIASRTRSKRNRKIINNDMDLFDEQIEEVRDDSRSGIGDDDYDDDDDDDDDRSSIGFQHPNLLSIHNRNLNASINSSTLALESLTSSLVAHHRHLNRVHQRRRRSVKSSSKLTLTSNNLDDKKQTQNKIVERQRLNYVRTPKLILHQPSRSNH